MSEMEFLKVRLITGAKFYDAEHRRMGPAFPEAMRAKIQYVSEYCC